MDENQINETINNSIIPDSYWLSQGHNQIYTNAMRALQLSMLMAGVQLLLLISPNNENSVSNDITICGIVNGIILPENILLHDDSLLPLWQQLGNAAASYASSEKNNCDELSISIVNVEIPSKVMKILAVAFEKLPIKKLILENNRLCSDGLIGLTNLVRKNSSAASLILSKNEIYNYEMLSLADATSKRSYEFILLDLISRRIEFDEVVISRLLALRNVGLINSHLGSVILNPTVFSRHLANNPPINCLYLNGNLFNDDDAVLFAQSLQSNTNLSQLWLKNNNFTDNGIKALYKCVYNDESLNLMHDANATCEMVLFDKNKEAPDGIPNKLILTFNEHSMDTMRAVTSKLKRLRLNPLTRENTLLASMIGRLAAAANITATPTDDECDALQELIRRGRARRLKILYALQDSNTDVLKMHYLKEVPLQYIPNVLVFLQECGDLSQSEEKNLDRVYQVIKSRPGVLMSEFAASRTRKKSNTPRCGRRQSSHQCRCSIM